MSVSRAFLCARLRQLRPAMKCQAWHLTVPPATSGWAGAGRSSPAPGMSKIRSRKNTRLPHPLVAGGTDNLERRQRRYFPTGTLLQVLRPSVGVKVVLSRYLGVSFHLPIPLPARYSENLNPDRLSSRQAGQRKSWGKRCLARRELDWSRPPRTVKRLPGSSVSGNSALPNG